MAACESPLPDLSSWTKKINPKTPSSSFGDIFREPPPPLFHHPPPPEPSMPSSSSSSSPSSSFWSPLSSLSETDPENESRGEESSSPFLQNMANSSHKKSESLQLCTEGLGFESFDDVEDNLSSSSSGQEAAETSSKQIYTPRRRRVREFRRGSSVGGGYPPPIPSLSGSGKPWVCFKSYREDGRFVLKEERIPTQEVLHASREDGRLRLHFVHRPEEEEVEEEETETNKEEDENIGEDEETTIHDGCLSR